MLTTNRVRICRKEFGYHMDFEQRNRITVETFGRFVKEKREQIGLSVRALAKRINISAVYLSDIENFNRPAPRKEEVLKSLEIELGLSPEETHFMYKAALASRTEDIDDYLKDNPRVCIALRMAQELPDDTIKEEWERFIERLIELNSESADSNDEQ